MFCHFKREREKIMEHKRQVQHLVNKSKSIVRLKPRNPQEKSSSPIIVRALCDFKQDQVSCFTDASHHKGFICRKLSSHLKLHFPYAPQKVICKGNEAILKDNSQRSKWEVTGPGGLDMLVPSVCLIIPPPNPLSISLASK